ncbi:MAG TPA: two-component regulator propeller domain-containing protein [Pyrinomonadaceae bacterium]|nr:two-component regulator propeller domain-containing protein [Pyrinomonadaceae bacterium]
MSQTETTSLHRWGAVTLFHGLPSDQVRAVAQDADGVMWFGTDAGLAWYDGRRVQTLTEDGLASRRVLALRADSSGALWVGTDDGAFVRAAGEQTFREVTETKGKRVAAIAATAEGRALLATSDGLLFDCRRTDDGGVEVKQLGERLTKAGSPAQAGKGQPLELTSLATAGEAIVVGTRGRGLLTVEPDGDAKEAASRPRAFFVEAVARDASGALFFGAQASANDGGLYRVDDGRLARPLKMPGATGTVTALAADERGDVYAATDGRGVFVYRGGQAAEHFTFAGTAGGLRSDTVNAVFVDREGVAWFGTPRGVCRYDPRGVGVEQLSGEAEGNFIRSLYLTSRGRLLAGTNRGLFARDDAGGAWREVEEVRGKTVYSLAEDSRGLLLVGTGAGLFVGLQTETRTPRQQPVKLTPEAKVAARGSDANSPRAAGKNDANDSSENNVDENVGSAVSKAGASGAKADEKNAGARELAAGSVEGNEDALSSSNDKKSAEPALSGSVRDIARFGDAVYVATFGRGLERFDGPGRRALVWPRAGDDARAREVVSLYADDSRRRLWIGTANAGVFYFDGKSVKTERALAPLAGGTVWSESAADGWLWLATSHGLYAFREGRALVEVARDVDARSVAAVPSADASGQDVPRAWCATAGAGVLRVALDEQFGAITSRLDTEQGLPTDNAFAVLALPASGEGASGEAASNGMSNSATKTSGTTNDGTTGEGAASGGGLKVENPSLLVGTTRGLARYEPSALAPVLKLTRVTAARTLQGEELQRGGALRLEYPQNGLVIDASASASRTFPEQFQYAFTLRDSHGRIVRQKLSHDSQFQMEGLPAGSYSVTARAYTLDLAASEPLVFNFEVARAPFPRTTVALSILLALALVALLWAVLQHRRVVRSGEELRDANRQLAAARLQLASEAEAERRRIARDLHDQTLADLRRLMLLTDEMQQVAAQPGTTTAGLAGVATVADPAALRTEIEAIAQEVRRICEDLSPSVLENVGFAAALEWALASALAHLPAGRKFAYDFACDEDLEERLCLAPGVQMQIYRIVQEAVSNVCRHAGAPHVSLAVRLDDAGDFALALEDDGAGFDAKNRKALKGRGIAGIRARASLVEAEVEWKRREGGGTIFVLRKKSAGNKDPTRET